MALRVRPGAGENQPPPLEGYDLFAENRPLVEALEREGGGGWGARVARARRGCSAASRSSGGGSRTSTRRGSARTTASATGSTRSSSTPRGTRCCELGVTHGLHALPWREPRARRARGAGGAVHAALAGRGRRRLPALDDAAAVPALRAEPALAAEWEPRLTSLAYDPGLRPASTKAGALCGMAMTERQGGSDVRANTTARGPTATGGRSTAHKWFCSAPMSDAFLVLAQAPDGLSCFLVPRVIRTASATAFRSSA